jgi:hypothetical protein
MDAIVVGIDVSKDRLDVAVRPTGESFVFKRTGVGIEDLIVRLEALSPRWWRSRLPAASRRWSRRAWPAQACRQIVEMIAAEGQRARRMSDKRLIKSIARLRKTLEKELSAWTS